MGSDKSHFNVSLNVRAKIRRQCSQTTSFEEKGEPHLSTEAESNIGPSAYQNLLLTFLIKKNLMLTLLIKGNLNAGVILVVTV